MDKKESGFVKEAEALLAIAKELEPLSKEKGCNVMARVCLHFDMYAEVSTHKF